MANRPKKRDSTGPLTDRELLTLKRVAEGDTHAEIASSLMLSRGYISESMSIAVSKIGAHNSHQACSTYGRHTGYLAAARLVNQYRFTNPADPAEVHVNHVLDGLAAFLRETGNRLIPR